MEVEGGTQGERNGEKCTLGEKKKKLDPLLQDAVPDKI